MSDYQHVSEVLAHYVRAADRRDGRAMSALFLPEAEVVINYVNAGMTERIGVLNGPDAIGDAVATMMKPHPPMGWSHHTTQDHLIYIDGDTATIDAQFVVFNTLGTPRPAGGWPPGILGLQGTVTPIEAGYYRTELRRVDGQWLIRRHQIDHDLPMALPG
ncbi:MAG: nuclear transport factor 2 family protein [Proteobacteria bacterium]|nr:nuclear transport factor 2 family protein [Pseudomonadota bacterium]